MSMTDTKAVDVAGDDKIACEICGARVHIIQEHLKNEHPAVSVAKYQELFCDAPLLSPRAKSIIAAKKSAEVEKVAREISPEGIEIAGYNVSKRPLSRTFELGAAAAARSKGGEEVLITYVKAPDEMAQYVPDLDRNYHFPIATLKAGLMALELNIPGMLWGHMGTGKSTMWEQIAARTGRPMIRIQHTANTEESHVIGQYLVKDGATVFELGPLPYAMKHGMIYCADEYDFARPSVMSLYQPVLEGKPLIIKEADAENRVIKPHPLFRMVATGNTNGTGDETGLYAGTMIQNAANYERFGMVEEVHYMEEKIEIAIISAQGGIPILDATKLVKFANMAREGFRQQKIGLPPSPRAMINAAKIGLRYDDYTRGIQFAYINRLSRIDQEAVREVMRRVGL